MSGPLTSSKEQWHLDKGVGLATIIGAMLFFLGGVAAWYSTVERVGSLELRYTVLNSRVVELLERQVVTDVRQDSALMIFRSEMREDSSQINSKVDRVLEILLKKQP